MVPVVLSRHVFDGRLWPHRLRFQDLWLVHLAREHREREDLPDSLVRLLGAHHHLLASAYQVGFRKWKEAIWSKWHNNSTGDSVGPRIWLPCNSFRQVALLMASFRGILSHCLISSFPRDVNPSRRQVRSHCWRSIAYCSTILYYLLMYILLYSDASNPDQRLLRRHSSPTFGRSQLWFGSICCSCSTPGNLKQKLNWQLKTWSYFKQTRFIILFVLFSYPSDPRWENRGLMTPMSPNSLRLARKKISLR